MESIATAHIRQPRVSIQHILASIVMTSLILLAVSVLGIAMALVSGSMPLLDMHLTPDGRHALVIHNALPCVPDEPPQHRCNESPWRREFKIIYSTLEKENVLLVVDLPDR